jgi:hypothetical protein
MPAISAAPLLGYFSFGSPAMKNPVSVNFVEPLGLKKVVL